jgi:hypothetical protein
VSRADLHVPIVYKFCEALSTIKMKDIAWNENSLLYRISGIRGK